MKTVVARRGKTQHAKHGRAAKNPRRQARTEFLAPLMPLLEQIEAMQQGDLYPFFSTDRDSAPNGRPIVLVANDYLGLSTDLRVRDAAREAIARLGTSRCASPLAGGQTTLHQTFAARLAEFLHQQAATLFPSGYQANVGVISALVRANDLILTDIFNHASIVDGARLSGAQVRHFQHNSAAHLERILAQEASGRRVLVIVEGVYSADGDIGDLPNICAAAHAHGALVMVDEAHSLGVLGDRGAGAAEHFDLLDEVDLIVGTMSKSLASVGGFVAADQNLVDAIAHSARALIFSAALPPAGAAAALTALEILQREPQRRERLWRNARAFLAGLGAAGFDTMNSITPVIPILVGDPARTIELTARLRARRAHLPGHSAHGPRAPEPRPRARHCRTRSGRSRRRRGSHCRHRWPAGNPTCTAQGDPGSTTDLDTAARDSSSGVMLQRRATIRAAQTAATMGLGDVQRTLRRLIEKNAGIPRDEIEDDSSVDGDLAMDSMSFLALQVAVEDTFGINCTPDEIIAASRFASIAALVHRRVTQAVNGNGATPPRTRRPPQGKQAAPPRKMAKTARRPRR